MAAIIDRAFWRGRRVFVTGHTGFKGAWLMAMLRALEARPTGYAQPAPTDPSLSAILGGDEPDAWLGDIVDASRLAAAVRDSGASIVLHLAAQALVRASYVDPPATYAANLMGTVNVLEACRQAPAVKTIVVVTTDKVYENRGLQRGYAEDDRLGGHDPYSNSKACAELAVACYRDSFMRDAGIGLASARAGNVIGGGDFAVDRIVPDAVRAFVAHRPLLVRNPLAVRPWQHVLDPIGGYLTLAQMLTVDPARAGAWNFGPQSGEVASVGDVADKLAALWGNDAIWEHDGRHHPHEAHLLKLDAGKAERELGWTQAYGLDAALTLTIDWYKDWAMRGDMQATTERQVDAFLDRAAL